MLNSDPEPNIEVDLGDPGDDQSIASIRSGGPIGGLPWWTPLLKYGFQCFLTLFVMTLCSGLIIFDIVARAGPGILTQICFPLIVSTMTLHFQLKSAARPLKVFRPCLSAAAGRGR